MAKQEIEQHLGVKIAINIRHFQDARNYKVSIDKAANVPSFHPRHDIRGIVGDLIRNRGKFSDWNNPAYYNIQTFKSIDNAMATPALQAAAGVPV